MNAQSRIEVEKEFSEKLVIHKNLGQEVVVTTVDKVRLCLVTNRELLTAKKEWLTPFGIFIALLTTFVAADFKKFVFEANVWSAIYFIGTLISFFWLCKSGYNALKHRSKDSIDSIVQELKAQTDSHSGQSHVLIIESARYGAQNQFCDLTDVLKSKIVNGKLLIVVNNDLAGDPMPNVPKQLFVSYSYNGDNHSISVPEGEALSIP